jgi:hypothetical protein
MNTTGLSMQLLRKCAAVLPGLIIACLLLVGGALLSAPDPVWQNLSSKRGEIPAPPGGSQQQTGAVVGDFDGDGVNEFILSFRQKPPALVWYRCTTNGWDPWVIEKKYLTIEAGGTVHDIDGDGDLDVVFGGDWQSSEVWWWENPAPGFDRNASWRRRVIKSGGKNQHHNQVFGDFLGIGKPQLAFWNQRARTIFLAEIPADPRSAGSWPLTEVVSGAAASSTPYTEGMSEGAVIGLTKTNGAIGNFQVSYLGNDGNDVILTAIPVPATQGELHMVRRLSSLSLKFLVLSPPITCRSAGSGSVPSGAAGASRC